MECGECFQRCCHSIFMRVLWFVCSLAQQWYPWCYYGYMHIGVVTFSVGVASPLGQKYVTMQSYVAQEEDEVSLPKGVTVEVVEKALSGWWKIKWAHTHTYTHTHTYSMYVCTYIHTYMPLFLSACILSYNTVFLVILL